MYPTSIHSTSAKVGALTGVKGVHKVRPNWLPITGHGGFPGAGVPVVRISASQDAATSGGQEVCHFGQPVHTTITALYLALLGKATTKSMEMCCHGRSGVGKSCGLPAGGWLLDLGGLAHQTATAVPKCLGPQARPLVVLPYVLVCLPRPPMCS
jgi:hypothetical protein